MEQLLKGYLIQKVKVMLFNTSRINDFSPTININRTELEVVDEMKLLGVMITNDVKWFKNTEYITKKVLPGCG